ncbi:MAG: hypothetical protein OCU22_01670 [Canidatus Methanoxibalbensis ujae]|nr:hypothetical protein [Candidatus Methanoxibalbensis ujae]
MARRIPRLMLGTSPFIGAAQFGRRAHEYRMRFFHNEENMVEIFVKSAEYGVKAVQLIVYEPLVNALKRAEMDTGDDFFVVATVTGSRFEHDLSVLEDINPEIIAVHALFCDSLDERIGGWTAKIRDVGAIPAAATHIPGDTIPEMDRAGYDVEFYLAPLNPVGYAMLPDFESAIRAIKMTDKGIIAIKPLAAGNIRPDREVFSFIFKYADAVSVGVTSDGEMRETFSAARAAEAKDERNWRVTEI